MVILVFLTQGLYMLSELRESYLQQSMSLYFHRGFLNISFRYVALAFAAMMLFVSYRYMYRDFLMTGLKTALELLLHLTILWIASSELVNWLDMAGSNRNYGLGLSILWGVYSLFLIILGIWRRKKHLRIRAIVLFRGTLLKLFFYDLSNLGTISKTIVFVSLGVMLLIISFLYNKYKHIITIEGDEQQ